VIEPIELTFAVACTPVHAFDLWARRTALWWPPSHSVTGDPQLDVVFEPRVGGRILERTPAGDEHLWGTVTVWEPPNRLAYRWHLRQDPADATDVEVTFDDAAGGGTEVRIVHGGWDGLGARASALRERNRGGWAGLVPAFSEACGAAAHGPRASERSRT
jgi:uncharacterized protein YndB with AHSA1/START domain